MKKYSLIFTLLIFTAILVFYSCKSKGTTDPCSASGTLCIENKMDSTVLVNIVQKHQQISLKKDYMQCLSLEANVAYTFSITGSGYTKADTTILILPCDNKLFIVKQ